MTREVKYNGFTAVPSDHEAPDGDLAAALNLVPEDGQLKPIPQPVVACTMPSSLYTVAFIHKTSSYTHYILMHATNRDQMWWVDEQYMTGTIDVGNMHRIAGDVFFSRIRSFNAVGNTLLVLADDGMHYVLWKGTDYQYLGNHLPELTMSFGLQGTSSLDVEFHVTCGTRDSTKEVEGGIDVAINFGATTVSNITDAVLPHVNKFIAERSVNQGKFVFPFFVRWAYRLYDDSLVMHSSPVLMITSSKVVTPQVFVSSLHYDTDLSSNPPVRVSDFNARVGAYVFDLDCQCLAGKSSLQEWSDIVQSVDIFISSPLYSYNQNGEIYSLKRYTSERYGYTVSKIASAGYYKKESLQVLDAAWELELPSLRWEDIQASIRDCADFRLIHSYSLSELPDTRGVIGVSPDTLKTLLSRETMSDDYDSHDTMIPQYSFVYNSRLNIANIDKQLAVHGGKGL